ncbi:MAG: redoxin domain-containing protein [Planctomycetes bacterium]|nr:redoxin domain-containing protein [Planctomycetota bacterium]
MALVAAGCDSGPAPAPPPPAPGPETARPSAPLPPPAAVPATAPADFLAAHGLQGRIGLIAFGSLRDRLSQKALETMATIPAAGGMPDLVLAAVAMADDAKAVEAHYGGFPPPFPVVPDADGALARALGVGVHPTAVLVDRAGRVRYHGPFPQETHLYDWVDALGREKTEPAPDAVAIGLWGPEARRLLDATRLPRLAGDPARLADFIQPGGLLVVFADVQCPFAGEAITDVKTVVEGLAKHGAATVLVNIGDAEADVRPYYAGKDPGVPVLFDVTRAIEKAWHVDEVPKAYYFTGQGALVYRGKAMWDNVAAAAEESLGLAPNAIQFSVRGTEYG